APARSVPDVPDGRHVPLAAGRRVPRQGEGVHPDHGRVRHLLLFGHHVPRVPRGRGAADEPVAPVLRMAGGLHRGSLRACRERRHVLALRRRRVGVHPGQHLPRPPRLAMTEAPRDVARAGEIDVRRGRRSRFDPLSSRSFLLWYGALGPPLLWGAHLALGDLIYELGCSSGMRNHAILSLSLRTWGLILTGVLLGM